MAITVESTTTANWATGSTTFTQNKPTGTVDDDFLVAVVFTGNDNGTTELTVSGVPSGWTLFDSALKTISGGSNNPVYVYIYTKTASSEPASWDWTLSTSGANFFYGGAVMRVTGTNQISSSDDGTSENDDTPNFTGGVTPLGANSLFIMATAVTDAPTAGFSSASYAITTSNPTWTELFDDNGGEGVGNSVHGSIAYAIRTEATATGDWTLSLTGGSNVADCVSILATLPAVTNATVTLDTPDIDLTPQAPTITGDANLTLDTPDINLTPQAPTVTGEANKWSNKDKTDTDPTITNVDKS